METQYGATPSDFRNLTYQEAQRIIGQAALWEFPYIFLTGKDFAFLRAFAIPAISKVSVAAREMVDRVGKRYADTTVLVGEFFVNPLDSERAQIALNRMNWIHSRYGNKIHNQHMVYTLCLLTCEGFQWVDRYDWRKTTALEKHASFVYWHEVGKRMGLVDMPLSYEDCSRFIELCEEQEMRADSANARIATSVIHLYQSTIPAFLAPLVKLVILAFMDSKLAGAFCLPSTQTLLIQSTRFFLESLLYVRAFVVRNFFLPRQSTIQVFGQLNEFGMRHMTFWEIEPWYVAKTTKFTFYSLYCKIFGLPQVGEDEWSPKGYRLETLGPKRYEGKGGKEILEVVENSKTGGCPYSNFGWKPTGVFPYMSPSATPTIVAVEKTVRQKTVRQKANIVGRVRSKSISLANNVILRMKHFTREIMVAT